MARGGAAGRASVRAVQRHAGCVRTKDLADGRFEKRGLAAFDWNEESGA